MQMDYRKNPRRNNPLRLIRGNRMGQMDYASIAAALLSSESGSGASAGTPAAASPAGGFGTNSTVSPAILTQVSPQISPTFIQSSGGGTQSGSAVQTQGGQSGQGGGTTPSPSSGAASPLTTGAPMAASPAGNPNDLTALSVPSVPSTVVTTGVPSWVMPVAIGLAAIGVIWYLSQNRG